MKLSNKISLFLLSGILTGIIFVFVSLYISYINQCKSIAELKIQGIEKTFDNIVHAETQKLYMVIDLLSEDDAIEQSLVSNNINDLYDYTLPIYSNLKEKYQISQMFFITPDPNNTCLLRMHRPEKKGDVITRKTYQNAIATKTYSSGLELGSRKFSLRALHPYYANDSLIAYLEVSEEIDPFFENLKQQTNDNYTMIIEHRYLSENGWDISKEKNDDNIHGDQIVVNSTSDDLIFAELLMQETPTEKRLLDINFKHNDSTYIIGALPVEDVKGRIVGAMYFSHNYTNLQNATKKEYFKLILFFAFVIVVVILTVRYIITKDIIRPIYKSISAIKEISNKKINFKLPVNREDELGELNQSINDVVDNFQNIIGNIQDASKQILEASNNFSSISVSLSTSSNTQASTIEEVSASMEEMVAAVESSSVKAMTTGGVSSKAADLMDENHIVFTQTIEAIQTINAKINSISEISSTTNLLALNASVEAARAGEHGKGFGVVAQEVKKLADQSDKVATEIKSLSESGNLVAEQASELLTSIIPEIRKSAQLVQEIVTSNIEQKTGAQHVNDAVLQLSEIANKHSSSSDEMTKSAEVLIAEAQNLSKLVDVFDVSSDHEEVND